MMRLIEDFANRIDSDKGYDNLMLANDLAKIAQQHFEESKKHTGINDRLGNGIKFGDTLRFADKVEWYRGEYTVRVAMGVMKKTDALAEIEAKPYHEVKVEGIEDYEWLLSDDIQTYWEVVK